MKTTEITISGPYGGMDGADNCWSIDWPTRGGQSSLGFHGPYLLFISCGHFCYGMGDRRCCVCRDILIKDRCPTCREHAR